MTPPKKNVARDAIAASTAAELVVSHLLRECHVETAAALLAEGEKLASVESARTRFASLRKVTTARGLLEGAMMRAKVRDQVRAGEIEDALRAADKILGGPLQKRAPALHFDLCCQHYVELVRVGRVSEALDYSQTTLAPLGSGEFPAVLKDLVPIIAYTDPSKSPLAHVLEEERRWALADRLSGALFAAQFEGYCVGDVPERSALETIVRHSKVVERLHSDYKSDSMGSQGTDNDKHYLNADEDDDDDDVSSDAQGGSIPRAQVLDPEVVDMNDD